ncbi:unnamed protein product [Polarella glacialis]|uniref:Hexosyltransferase n=1 Tax=Polarella glacialis TaxID=89957 RepID=A0A813IR05_POLGL|nr:unnamed protein product [Polarella glacialis]
MRLRRRFCEMFVFKSVVLCGFWPTATTENEIPDADACSLLAFGRRADYEESHFQATSKAKSLRVRIASGEYTEELVSQWAEYQEKMLNKLSPTGPAKILRVLVLSPVSGRVEAVDNFDYNMAKLKNNRQGDVFHFALHHYDNNLTEWLRRPWYFSEALVAKSTGPLCKAYTWKTVSVEMAQGYDYIWLMDGDMHLGYFSWDVYRMSLLMLDPLFSQPAIIPRAVGHRASDHHKLNMLSRWGDDNDTFPIMLEVDDIEVMTPIHFAQQGLACGTQQTKHPGRAQLLV